MSEIFFLNASEIEGSHIFYLIYMVVFYTLVLGSLPFSRNELLWLLFYVALAVWLNGLMFNLVAVVNLEEGGFLSAVMYVLAVIRTLVQPITLSLRITVNLLLGEIILIFLIFSEGYSLFLRSIYEFFVIFLQRRVFFYLLFSYGKN